MRCCLNFVRCPDPRCIGRSIGVQSSHGSSVAARKCVGRFGNINHFVGSLVIFLFFLILGMLCCAFPYPRCRLDLR